MSKEKSYLTHLTSHEDLITPSEKTRDGFRTLAKIKRQKAAEYLVDAQYIKKQTQHIKDPRELTNVLGIRDHLLVAAGVSDKALNHITEEDKTQAIKDLIEEYIVPAGEDFIDEVIYRYILTKGDSLGGSMRNVGGKIAQDNFTNVIFSILEEKKQFLWINKSDRQSTWRGENLSDEESLRGFCWKEENHTYFLIYNKTSKIIGKNIDLILLKSREKQYHKKLLEDPSNYALLGELKGGIDPAGADEHWKTANSALERIRVVFSETDYSPGLFFAAAAIETDMSREIWAQLEAGQLDNAANITDIKQLHSICKWIINSKQS